MLRSGVSMLWPLALGSIVPVLWLVCATPTRATAAEVPPPCTPTVARIVSVQGIVEVRRAGQPDWSAVTRLDTPVCQGDLVHAGARSRAALVILPEKFVRLDQNSTLSISVAGEETVVEFFQDETTPRDACGAGYFITRFPRKFKVRTPFVNAAVEGTEFLVSMSCSASSVAVFEGKVSAETLLANAQRFILNSGEAISAGPGEPPAIKVLVRPVDAVQWALYYPPLSEPGPGVGPDQLCDQVAPEDRSRCLMVRAEQRLRVGRVDEAQADIDASLKLVPDNSDANALLSVISVVQNDRQRALALAQRATQLDPVNARAWIALSYAQQASFKLEDALSSAQRAAELEPRNSIALTRMAELMMSLGRIRSAERAAQAAVDANPNDSRAHTILGFVRLAQIDIRKAKADFETAIALDSSDPLPRLGLGLAIIRSGNLTAGREQIEIAVALDPTNSLLRSYVGKAYYEERTAQRDGLASTQFGLAKQLDPKDPTPWFYDAILKQTQNRPVEALEDLQKSIELNDNRRVYRSRLLLDRDLAARQASEASIYSDLGFDARARFEAARSLNTDPTAYSAHRFLADAYLNNPRYDVARQSELFQSQIRQPLTLTPLQPQLNADHFDVLRNSGPTSGGLYEFNPLFTRNSLALQLSGVFGGNNTMGSQGVLSGVYDKLGGSIAYLNYNTDGFRENNEAHKDLYEGFLQYQAGPDTSLQLDLRNSYTRIGDPTLRFDPGLFLPGRDTLERTSYRLAARHQIESDVELLASAQYIDAEEEFFFLGTPSSDQVFQTSVAELQGTLHRPWGNAMLGTSYYVQNTDITAGDFKQEFSPHATSIYFYSWLTGLASNLVLQLGVSWDARGGLIAPVTSTSQINPKLGLTWNVTSSTTVRAAYFRYVKKRFLASESLEPTQVAGFNQVFDDLDGTQSRVVGIALDQRFGERVFAGAEASKRDLTVPQDGTDETFPWKESYGLVYFLVAPSRWLALTARYRYEKFERPQTFPGFEAAFTNVQTHEIPLSANVFTASGLTFALTETHVYQTGDFFFGNFLAGNDNRTYASNNVVLDDRRRSELATASKAGLTEP